MSPSVSLIIPAFNEEGRLPSFLTSIVAYVERHPDAIQEIIVVDDGSTDGTTHVVQQFMPRLPTLRLLQHPVNQGKGAAVQTGVNAAIGEYIIFIDADGATPIDELPKMISALADADIAVGNRWQKESRTHRSSFFRHIAGWTNRSYTRFLGLGDIDTMCGFKGYHRVVAHKLFTDLLEKRWLFDTEVAYKSVRWGYTTLNFPIAWKSVEGSKLSRGTLLKTAFQIWPLILRIKKQKVHN